MRRRLAGLAAAALALAAAPGLLAQPADQKSDWELEQEKRFIKEGEVRLPPRYREEDLLEFEVGRTVSFRFYIDKASISIDADQVVRYTLVARSPRGVENVSYEGIHCTSGRTRGYAVGQPGGGWRPVNQDWAEVQKLWTRVLRTDYFCPLHRAIYNPAEGVDALQRGGHRDRAN